MMKVQQALDELLVQSQGCTDMTVYYSQTQQPQQLPSVICKLCFGLYALHSCLHLLPAGHHKLTPQSGKHKWFHHQAQADFTISQAITSSLRPELAGNAQESCLLGKLFVAQLTRLAEGESCILNQIGLAGPGWGRAGQGRARPTESCKGYLMVHGPSQAWPHTVAKQNYPWA